MSTRSRSGVPDSQAQIDALSVEELRREMESTKLQLAARSHTLVRKLIEKRLHRLERALEKRTPEGFA
jgi:hypothetical protein